MSNAFLAFFSQLLVLIDPISKAMPSIVKHPPKKVSNVPISIISKGLYRTLTT